MFCIVEKCFIIMSTFSEASKLDEASCSDDIIEAGIVYNIKNNGVEAGGRAL